MTVRKFFMILLSIQYKIYGQYKQTEFFAAFFVSSYMIRRMPLIYIFIKVTAFSLLNYSCVRRGDHTWMRFDNLF